jgi:2-polyprenyl-3-methyl-5-hydroxy-6-metoxy-1,4-benzoquinol methylase
LSETVPDLGDQYTVNKIDMEDAYTVEKVRGVHSFQIGLALKSIGLLDSQDAINIVDVGDSSGTHISYLKPFLDQKGIKGETLSVNLDPVAVEKIKKKGLKAILCRAEELHLHKDGVKTDIFLCYEMLEHLLDPISFLHNMASKAECSYFVITVPYVRKSRLALHHVRKGWTQAMSPEKLHVFEFSPDEWNLLFKFAGWEVVDSDIYTQYPARGSLKYSKYLWRKFDFEGFYGVILKKNLETANLYEGWK